MRACRLWSGPTTHYCICRVLLDAKESYVVAENVVEAAHSLGMVYMRLASRRTGVVQHAAFPKLPIDVPGGSLSMAHISEYYETLSKDLANVVTALERINARSTKLHYLFFGHNAGTSHKSVCQ